MKKIYETVEEANKVNPPKPTSHEEVKENPVTPTPPEKPVVNQVKPQEQQPVDNQPPKPEGQEVKQEGKQDDAEVKPQPDTEVKPQQATTEEITEIPDDALPYVIQEYIKQNLNKSTVGKKILKNLKTVPKSAKEFLTAISKIKDITNILKAEEAEEDAWINDKLQHLRTKGLV